MLAPTFTMDEVADERLGHRLPLLLQHFLPTEGEDIEEAAGNLDTSLPAEVALRR